jgi:hypothetical protein
MPPWWIGTGLVDLLAADTLSALAMVPQSMRNWSAYLGLKTMPVATDADLSRIPIDD